MVCSLGNDLECSQVQEFTKPFKHLSGFLMRIDLVIPTKGEWSLPFCVRRVRKYVPVNRLIMVGPENLGQKVRNLADVFVPFNERNIGKARAKGLEYVETEYYASIDSDVLINPNWYKWCMKTIRHEDVGACQGYAKAIAKIYGRHEEDFIRRGGLWGKSNCSLGNTLLKTDVVRELGMPQISLHEDWNLLLRMENAGYRWVSNIDLVSVHLITDVDVWKHHISWGRKEEVRPVFQVYGVETSAKKICLPERIFSRFPALSNVYQIGYYSSVGLFKHPLKENLFEIACRFFMIYGRILKTITDTDSHNP